MNQPEETSANTTTENSSSTSQLTRAQIAEVVNIINKPTPETQELMSKEAERIDAMLKPIIASIENSGQITQQNRMIRINVRG